MGFWVCQYLVGMVLCLWGKNEEANSDDDEKVVGGDAEENDESQSIRTEIEAVI